VFVESPQRNELAFFDIKGQCRGFTNGFKNVINKWKNREQVLYDNSNIFAVCQDSAANGQQVLDVPQDAVSDQGEDTGT